MTKSFLVIAGCLFVASAAWAAPPPGPQGSGDNVSTALAPTPPAPPPGPIPSAGPPPGPQGSGDNVSAVFATPKPAAAPASASSSKVNKPAAMQAVQSPPFNPMAFSNRTDCLNAAQAAMQPLSQCNSVPVK